MTARGKNPVPGDYVKITKPTPKYGTLVKRNGSATLVALHKPWLTVVRTLSGELRLVKNEELYPVRTYWPRTEYVVPAIVVPTKKE